MPREFLQEVAESVKLNDGAHRLIKALKHFGYRTAVISGGFQYVGEYLAQDLGIDYIYANTLEIVDGKMTGEVVGDIVDAESKARILMSIAEREGITLEQTIAVGDGANDLPMLTAAGLGNCLPRQGGSQRKCPTLDLEFWLGRNFVPHRIQR